jgi:hypothetical protein
MPVATKPSRPRDPRPIVDMAIARPVRALGTVAILMWCFFIWMLFRPTVSPLAPSARFTSNEQDPNLDREHLEHPGASPASPSVNAR